MTTQSFPSRIAFCCLQPAATGGTTPVVDTAAVVDALRPAMRDRFRAQVRFNFNPAITNLVYAV